MMSHQYVEHDPAHHTDHNRNEWTCATSTSTGHGRCVPIPIARETLTLTEDKIYQLSQNAENAADEDDTGEWV